MAENSNPEPTRVYTLKITLEGIEPPVWRRLQLTDNMTLGDLHAAIQVAMGWEECHLHEFEVAGERYGGSYPGADPDEDDDVANEDDVRLGSIIRQARQRFLYVYDFGDSWEHTVLVEATTDKPDPNQQYPVCLAGERACPPEDCGGPWNYAQMLEVYADPDHDDYSDTVEWLGRKFNPEAFSADAVNEALRRTPFT